MTVRSHGAGGRRAAYPWDRRRFQEGQGGVCGSVPAGPRDATVADPGLGARTREHRDLARAVLTQRAADARELDRPWPRPRDAVAPETRLVARTLERRWHETLPPVDARARASAEARRRQRLEGSSPAPPQILRVAADRPAVWNAPPTTQTDRQELVRVLVTPVALTPLDGPPRQTRVPVLWQTPATPARVVPRPTTHARVRTPLEVVDAIATRATGRTDDAMAAVLKAQGLRSGRHQPRTPDAVAWIRYTSHLRTPGSEPPMAARLDARPDGRDSTRGNRSPI